MCVYAQVAAFVTVLDKDLTDRKKTSEVDVSAPAAGSYGSLITRLCKQRLKHVPVAYHREPPKQLIDTTDAGLSAFVFQ